MTAQAITSWLCPLRRQLDPSASVDWSLLHSLADALDRLLLAYPVGAAVAPTERSHRLLTIRRELTRQVGLTAQPASWQMLAQFICGYRDLDLRDATGLGHGELIARHGSPATRDRWVPRLRGGDLAGIAVTEVHGGSRPAASRTHAVANPNGSWLVSGRKTWISRLHEAAVFVVFFRNPRGGLTAAAVDATSAGLGRHLVAPSGLGGWTWGVLDLDSVPVHVDDVLEGDGMVLLREHFTRYRPLVTATALGAAASVFDTVVAAAADRVATGELSRLRDSALAAFGRAHAQILAALLATAAVTHSAATGYRHVESWSAAIKAFGVDTAHCVAAELSLLLGASGFRADCQVAKIRRDLGGLLYADGIHDSLYRAAGKRHVMAASQVTGRPCSHNTVTPCAAADMAAAMRSASKGLTRCRTSAGSQNRAERSSPSVNCSVSTSPSSRTPPSKTNTTPSGRESCGRT